MRDVECLIENTRNKLQKRSCDLSRCIGRCRCQVSDHTPIGQRLQWSERVNTDGSGGRLIRSGGNLDRNATCDVVASLMDFVDLKRASTLSKNLSFHYLLLISRQSKFSC
jgi:hypothetical protein